MWDSDPDVIRFLRDGGYSSVEEWARDSDYTEIHGEWFTEEGHRVDIEECAYYAMIASTEGE